MYSGRDSNFLEDLDLNEADIEEEFHCLELPNNFIVWSCPIYTMTFTKNPLAQRPADYSAKAKALVTEMTLEEKALLLSGDGWWHTHPIDRLEIPALSISDGPHGLRKVDGAGLPTSRPSTCF